MRLGLLLVAATTAAAWAPAPARAPLVCRPPVPVNLLAMSAAGSGPVASARQGLVVAKDYVFAGGPVTPGSVARVLGYCWLAGAVPYVVISGASCGAAWADFMRANGVSPLAAGQYVPFLIGRQASANRAFRSMAQLRVLAAVLLVPAMRSAMRVVREACPLSDRPRLQSALATGVLIVVTAVAASLLLKVVTVLAIATSRLVTGVSLFPPGWQWPEVQIENEIAKRMQDTFQT